MTRTTRYLPIVGASLFAVAVLRLIAGVTASSPVSPVVAQNVTVQATLTAAAQTAEAGLTAIAATNPPPTASLPVATITVAPVPIVSPVPTTRTGAVASGANTTLTVTSPATSGTSVNGWAVAAILAFIATISILGGAWYRMYRQRKSGE